MAAGSTGFATQLDFRLEFALPRIGTTLELGNRAGAGAGARARRRRAVRVEGRGDPAGAGRIVCCCSDSAVPARRTAGKGPEKSDDWRFESMKMAPTPAMPFASPQYVGPRRMIREMRPVFLD